MMRWQTLLSGLVVGGLLVGCQSTKKPNAGRYSLKHDEAPTRLPDDHEMVDPTPVYEPPSRGGNKDYSVLGKSYKVLSSAEGFEQTGISSWYGRKFHGHLTSNGEVYDMYKMSAAHKNLPLPSWLKVTNLANGKQVVVRVNDRGPFHESRIIDLSYSAAAKLDMLKDGTAKVHIEAIATSPDDVPETPLVVDGVVERQAVAGYQSDALSAIKPFTHIEVEQDQDKSKLDSAAAALSMLYQLNADVEQSGELYTLVVGPIDNEMRLIQLMRALQAAGYPASGITR